MNKKHAAFLFNIMKLQAQSLAILLALIINTKGREVSWGVSVNAWESMYWKINFSRVYEETLGNKNIIAHGAEPHTPENMVMHRPDIDAF